MPKMADHDIATLVADLAERAAALDEREAALTALAADLAEQADRLAVAQQDWRETRATTRRAFA